MRLGAPRSLAARLAIFVSLGLGVVWLIGVVATAVVLQSEQDELLDQELSSMARIFLPVLVHDFHQRAGRDQAPILLDPGEVDLDEALIYQLLDPNGRPVVRSGPVDAALFPPAGSGSGYATTPLHVFYTSAADPAGFAVQVGDPLSERREAFRESFRAFLAPMLAMLPLAYLLVGWIARNALRPLAELERGIGARHGGELEPMDVAGQPRELAAITRSLNGFMDRLARSLDNERGFATNAAHELRTPVAAALAQVQRLRAEAVDATARARAAEVEHALKRLSARVTRLLQLARADAGVGRATHPNDLRRLLEISLDDYRRDPDRDARLRLTLAPEPIFAPIDADAFAILVANLIDNAFVHGAGGVVTVNLDARGRLSVVNDAPVLPAALLPGLTRRFRRAPGQAGGFGIGLAIAEAIARQAGGELTLRSPAPGRDDGFEARVDFGPALVEAPTPA